MLSGKIIEKLFDRIEKIEKMDLSEKSEEIKKILTDLKQIGHSIFSEKSGFICSMMSNIGKTIEFLGERETEIAVRFNKLSITIDGEKALVISLSKKK